MNALSKLDMSMVPSLLSPCSRLNPDPIIGYSLRANFGPLKSSTSSSPEAQTLTQGSSLLQEITRLCDSKKLSEAFTLLQEHSKDESFNPLDHASAVGCLLQACGHERDIEIGRKVHSLITMSGQHDDDGVVSNCLITMYSMCRSPLESRLVFDNLRERNLFQWNAMVSGYTRNELYDDALELFIEFVSVTEFKPDSFTLPCVVKACTGLLDAEWGRGIHGMAVKMELNGNVFVGNALIAMYGKCGYIEDALQLFEKMPDRNLVSWNSMLCVFPENGISQDSYHLFMEMLEEGFVPDVATLVTVLPVCANEGDIEIGMILHSMAVKLGLSRELKVNNALLDMYCKCGHVLTAEILFNNLDQKNVVSWNSMIAGYSREGDILRTFGLLRRMQLEEEKIMAKEVTILNVLPVFSDKSEIMSLKEVHGCVFRNYFQFNEMVANALIASYANCKSFCSAELVFYGIDDKTTSTWNALISGYAQNGQSMEAVESFHQMTASGLEPDSFTIGSIILACTHFRSLLWGKEIHAYMLRKGLESDTFIITSLLSLYTHCQKLVYARNLFERNENKDIVHWNAIISGCSQNGYLNEALALIRRMLSDSKKPHPIALSSIFGACSQLSALRLGRQLHCYALKSSLMEDLHVGCSIINMYGKCGSIEQSLKVFKQVERGVVSYNVIIAALAIHGRGKEAVKLFEEMRKFEIEPDEFTFIGLLMACSHSGMVDEGIMYLTHMRRIYSLKPKLEHYACAVDMLGRAGRVAEGLKLIDEMDEEPDVGILSSLLSCCRIYGNLDTGEKVARRLLELYPKRSESYVLLSNMYAKLGRWDDVRRVRAIMKENGVRKEVGCSWIEVGGKVYSFVVADNSHREIEKIRETWRSLEEKIREVGFAAKHNYRKTCSSRPDLKVAVSMEILEQHSVMAGLIISIIFTSSLCWSGFGRS
ncbi:hypothetical protein CDL15_Pgr008774 [Punica granatum]|uniref:Pentatricopeptide repeat-containing protein At1g18485 n=1 Tax=Punica granatum TaxID=22663 RepID=A0A218VX70_PUNGR|nr:hypothetical protein CDL15_Pgr008774 [Punica granatum]